MAKQKLTQADQVNELVEKLAPTDKAFVEYLVPFVLGINSQISEQVKWNSVSFYYNGKMEAFDPKEYKRDILVCNIHRGKFLLIFPTGSKLKTGLKTKDYPDGRKIVTLESLEDLQQKTAELSMLIRDWLIEVG